MTFATPHAWGDRISVKDTAFIDATPRRFCPAPTTCFPHSSFHEHAASEASVRFFSLQIRRPSFCGTPTSPSPAAPPHAAKALFAAQAAQPSDIPNPDNVQGDIYLLFPKAAENFIFFVISDPAKFIDCLKSYTPTSSTEVLQNLKNISAAKGSENNPRIDIVQSQIAFSRAGLNALGIKDAVGDPHFDAGSMWDEWDTLGDSKREGYADVFLGGKNHGIIMIAASDQKLLTKESTRLKNLFGPAITRVMEEAGNVRPGKNKGHEHFGFMDGVSQPALRGLVQAHTGQLQADPGVVIMGYKGDPLLPDPKNPKAPTRPAWTKDGSFMVFRKLEQNVEDFNTYLKQNGPYWRNFVPKDHDSVKDPLTDAEGAELWGARMLGRWKSGAPTALAPVRDNAAMAADKDQVNNFDYLVDGQVNPSDYYCPFTAHARKTAPRNLDPYIEQPFLESSLIVRSGIPYGLEIGDPNATTRGLLFVCYQSSIDNGFFRQTVGFAGNDFFPHTSLVPTKQGQDPILGGPPKVVSATSVGSSDVQPGRVTLQFSNGNGQNVQVDGFAAPVNTSATGQPQRYFVTSRGGEYFFVPSLPTLRKWAGKAPASKLDLVFLQDVTGSQSQYIASVKNNINTICSKIAASPKFQAEADPEKIRVGLIAFRDYPQKGNDYGMITKTFDFTSDVSAMQANVASLSSSGGGDGPEAQTTAIAEALKLTWRNDAMKFVILITDAPPHGIGEVGDYFPSGVSGEADPRALVDKMKQQGITLYIVACEPTLSREYDNALDFYQALANRNGGRMVPLKDAASLADFITYSALEVADVEAAVTDYGVDLHSLVTKQGSTPEDAAKTLQNVLNSRAVKNQAIWETAATLADARSQVKAVTTDRILPKFNKSGATQAVDQKEQAVSLDQATRMVTHALARNS
ncbi:Dye-decolorizing peroxidase msp1 [Grifola frondosa]|uniref:Dye-decolorizing peroxidase msp1 n=1 Tax=Grifola frondosa TaxID=5627 RepID=A0A1C7MK40_GRIFR|nr:Dye-decolorizing peroxidase msp1 [Grifola frondosa]